MIKWGDFAFIQTQFCVTNNLNKIKANKMEVAFALPLIFIPFVMPLISGLMAKTQGRKFWPWFFLGIPLPLIANVILLCLPAKTKAKPNT